MLPPRNSLTQGMDLCQLVNMALDTCRISALQQPVRNNCRKNWQSHRQHQPRLKRLPARNIKSAVRLHSRESQVSCSGLENDDDVEDEGVADDLKQRIGSVRPHHFTTSLKSLLTDIDDDLINLSPVYQRGYVWDVPKACRLIESILLKSFVPSVVLHKKEDETHDVVDGKQRMITISSFRSGKFPDGTEFRLNGLEALKDLNGSTWDDLEDKDKRSFRNFHIGICTFDTPSEDTILRIYEDLNCGAIALSNQQIRKAVYQGEYTALLDELAKYDKFLKLMQANSADIQLRNEEDRELILRFFALYRKGPKVFKGRMKHFLTKEVANHRNLPREEAQNLAKVFKDTIELAYNIYGSNAFRLWDLNRKMYMQFKPALFDSVMYVLSHIKSKRSVYTQMDAIRDDWQDMMAHDLFSSKVLGRYSADWIGRRIDAYGDRLESVLKAGEQDGNGVTNHTNGTAYKRYYSVDLKKQLFASSPVCGICGNLIVDIEEAEVDHIIPVSQGGPLSDDNAQLAHRFCNRSKGARIISFL